MTKLLDLLLITVFFLLQKGADIFQWLADITWRKANRNYSIVSREKDDK